MTDAYQFCLRPHLSRSLGGMPRFLFALFKTPDKQPIDLYSPAIPILFIEKIIKKVSVGAGFPRQASWADSKYFLVETGCIPLVTVIPDVSPGRLPFSLYWQQRNGADTPLTRRCSGEESANKKLRGERTNGSFLLKKSGQFSIEVQQFDMPYRSIIIAIVSSIILAIILPFLYTILVLLLPVICLFIGQLLIKLLFYATLSRRNVNKQADSHKEGLNVNHGGNGGKRLKEQEEEKETAPAPSACRRPVEKRRDAGPPFWSRRHLQRSSVPAALIFVDKSRPVEF